MIYKAQPLWALSLGLKPRKAQKSTGWACPIPRRKRVDFGLLWPRHALGKLF